MNVEPKPQSPLPIDLRAGLREIVLHPVRTLVPPWSWKAAFLSAVVRSCTFFGSNLQSGTKEAFRALIVEATYAVLTAGLIGAISQRLRAARPQWVTAVLLCMGLPALMLLAQLLVHRAAHTPHVGPGVVSSFCFAAVTAAFTLFAMQHGSLLGGVDGTSLRHDIHHLPRIALSFLLLAPRSLLQWVRDRRRT